ncbi:NHL repeat-containing protein [Falsiroseomonas tokyonensis]|uniref:Peptidase n=1 Tax=Falsiroseomonas tokyonensis TaxID=430521 RepID=A0ABV7C555_9PROT|nr:peptidase [Falsiroseomonas tokyonensis]MBU8541302.1 peptidase [Falsiroseomonas tokyonensis]
MTQDKLVVALSETTYQVERPWGVRGTRFAGAVVSDVAVDSQGNAHVLLRYEPYARQAATPGIAVIAPDGTLLREMPLPEVSDGHGIAIGPGDEILVTDRDRHEIRILDADGRTLLCLGTRNRPGQPFSHPAGAAIHPSGDIFVADGYGHSLVHRFSADGRPLLRWGEPGTGPGQFTTPHDLAFGRKGEVIVCDRENNRIQAFDTEGRFLWQAGDLYHPMGIAVDAEGRILVTDQIPRLSLFSPEGRLIGRCRPVLNGGHGLALGAGGCILLAEIAENWVTRLAPR